MSFRCNRLKAPLDMPLLERVTRWLPMDNLDECWPWPKAVNDAGYGQIRYKGRTFYTHRIMYENFTGPIPPGYQLDHLCRVTRCANPKHLEAVTPGENTRRGQSPGIRIARSGACAAGHARTSENTYVRLDGRGVQCRVCRRDRERRQYRERRNAA